MDKIYDKCCGIDVHKKLIVVCFQHAISMVEDEEGVDYPQIDTVKCIRCFQCVKVCPIKKKVSEDIN